jgi:Flp pilus assembly protein TadG
VLRSRNGAGHGHRDGERGSVLFLFAAGFLAMLVLAAIAIDASNAYLQQRELADAADGAANDAVTYGLDQAHLRTTGEYRLDPGRVADAIERSVTLADLGPGVALSVDRVGIDGDGNVVVAVTLVRTVDHIFRPGAITVRATGIADARFEP